MHLLHHFAAMENTTIQSILEELGMKMLIDIFKVHELDFELLKNMTETDLQSALNGIGLSVGRRWQIIKKIQEKKSRGKFNLHNFLINYFFKKCLKHILFYKVGKHILANI